MSCKAEGMSVGYRRTERLGLSFGAVAVVTLHGSKESIMLVQVPVNATAPWPHLAQALTEGDTWDMRW